MSGKDKYAIIAEYAEKKKIEEFIDNTAKTSAPELNDLAQDIYIYLLEYDDDKIIGLYERNELDYFIARMITNQYISTSSQFYYKYKKFINNSEPLNNDIVEYKTWMDKTRKHLPKD